MSVGRPSVQASFLIWKGQPTQGSQRVALTQQVLAASSRDFLQVIPGRRQIRNGGSCNHLTAPQGESEPTKKTAYQQASPEGSSSCLQSILPCPSPPVLLLTSLSPNKCKVSTVSQGQDKGRHSDLHNGPRSSSHCLHGHTACSLVGSWYAAQLPFQPLFLTHHLPKHTTPLSKVPCTPSRARWGLHSVTALLQGRSYSVYLSGILFVCSVVLGWNADWSMCQTRTLH